MFRERPIVVTAYVVCTIMALLAVTPFFWVLMTALKSNPEINAWPPHVFPHPADARAFPSHPREKRTSCATSSIR